MAWGKFEESLPTHPKMIAAGAAAAWLWFCGVQYCRVNLTDGFIPKAMVPSLSPGLKSPYGQAQKLVDVNLWEIAMGGYQVHDYLVHNNSRAQVEAYRLTERQRKGKTFPAAVPVVLPAGRRPDSEDLPRLDSSHARVGVRGASASASAEDLGVSEIFPEESPRETALAPVWRESRPVHNRSLVGNHQGCYPAPEACGRGICVPGWLGAAWTRQFTDPVEAERVISETVRMAIAGLPDGPVGDEPKKFWQAVWARAHGTQAPSTAQTKGNATVSAMNRVLARRAARGEA